MLLTQAINQQSCGLSKYFRHEDNDNGLCYLVLPDGYLRRFKNGVAKEIISSRQIFDDGWLLINDPINEVVNG